MSEPSATPDPRLYRRLIDWERRLAAEGPRLVAELGLDRGSRLLDLGCGTGEHDRWLAARGVAVVAVDRSPEMAEAARDAALTGARGPEFAPIDVVEAAIEALPESVAGPFDAAICLGNTFVHLGDAASVDACLAGVAARLKPRGRLLVQILNYALISSERRRAFPPSLRPGDAGRELVFLRFMDHIEPGFVDFEAVVLEREAGQPTRLLESRRSRLRAWTHSELEPRFAALVGPTRLLGGIDGSPFDPAASHDLVLVAERARS